jgi:hypothetical protein
VFSRDPRREGSSVVIDTDNDVPAEDLHRGNILRQFQPRSDVTKVALALVVKCLGLVSEFKEVNQLFPGDRRRR